MGNQEHWVSTGNYYFSTTREKQLLSQSNQILREYFSHQFHDSLRSFLKIAKRLNLSLVMMTLHEWREENSAKLAKLFAPTDARDLLGSLEETFARTCFWLSGSCPDKKNKRAQMFRPGFRKFALTSDDRLATENSRHFQRQIQRTLHSERPNGPLTNERGR